jgi:nucleoside-diphosphate-sugar epimerase
MRILLIGGSGFIGRHLVQLWRSSVDVTIFHRGTTPVTGTREIIGDRKQLAASADALRAVKPDIVIDLILSSGTQARELMSVFRGAAGRVVALSSADVYRACAVLHRLEPEPLEPLPLTETSALRTQLHTYPPAQLKMVQQLYPWIDDDYDKIPVEREIMGDAKLPGTVLRLPMVYGPGDPLHRFHGMLKRMDDRRPAILFEETLAAWRAPRGFVENVAAAIALAATDHRAAGQIYNVAEAESFSEVEWARMIARAAGWTGEFIVRPADRVPEHLKLPGNANQHWVVDSTKIRRELGYAEPVSRDEAIRRTIEWERANPPSGFTPHRFDYEAEDRAMSIVVSE